MENQRQEACLLASIFKVSACSRSFFKSDSICEKLCSYVALASCAASLSAH